MEANELMIGDWMFIKDYPIKALPQKVKSEHFVRSLVEFEPIPLTSEILEKNGRIYNNEDVDGDKINILFDLAENRYPCMTQQCVMAWLRKNNIFIDIDTTITTDKKVYYSASVGTIENGWKTIVECVEIYEVAVEMALKHCLKNYGKHGILQV